MHYRIYKTFMALFATMGLLVAASAHAAPTPHDIVQNTTDQVISTIETGKKDFAKNPDAFYQKLDQYLSQFFEFRLFAKNVMGKYGNNAATSAMSAAEKKQFNQRLDRFVRVFKEGLISRYGASLLLFDGQKIEVVPANADDLKRIAANETVIVTQYIYDNKGTRYSGHYTMKPNAAGEWKVRNVTIEGVNVGKVYRKQFYAAMQRYDNDMDKVIDNWSVALDN